MIMFIDCMVFYLMFVFVGSSVVVVRMFVRYIMVVVRKSRLNVLGWVVVLSVVLRVVILMVKFVC